MIRTGLGLLLVVAACGVAYEGPPPRFAEAPAEPHPSPAPEETPDTPPEETADAGVPHTDGAVAIDADAGAADGGVGGVALATGVLTQEQWSTMLDAGRRKWNRVCGECHGTGIGPNLNGRRLTAERVRQTVREGRGDMRPLSLRRVSAEELEAVLVFLSTIRGVTDVTPPGQ